MKIRILHRKNTRSATPGGGCRRRRHGAAAPGRRGFTLLEVMVAIFIFALVLTAIYSTWLAILKGTKISLEAAAAVQRSRIAMHALEDSLLTAQMYVANRKHYAFVADQENMSLVARLPASFPGVGRYGDQIVRRVSFYLEPGEEGLDQLMMTQVPLLLDFENSEIQPYTISLAKDVSAFDLLFWDLRQQDWVDEWTDTNEMPRLVQITLGLGKLGGNASRPRDVATRIVAVPAMAVAPDVQGLGRAGAPGAPPVITPGQPNQPVNQVPVVQ